GRAGLFVAATSCSGARIKLSHKELKEHKDEERESKPKNPVFGISFWLRPTAALGFIRVRCVALFASDEPQRTQRTTETARFSASSANSVVQFDERSELSSLQHLERTHDF